MLHFGMRAPLSFEQFLELCRGIISDRDIEVLESLPHIDGYIYDDKNPTLKKWHAFDTALRNALVRIRAGRKHVDPARYLRHDGYEDPMIFNIAMNAYKNPSILESEMILDRERWHKLDELSVGHYFGIDILIIYALKLLILERWNRIETDEGSKVLEDVSEVQVRKEFLTKTQ